MAGEYQLHLFKKNPCTSTLVQGFFCSFLDEKYRQQTQTFANMRIVDKWTMPIKEWPVILDNLMIYFGDRVKITLSNSKPH